MFTEREVIAGTLAYMAPEQTGRMNRSIDSRSDLYALGVTLYEMVTGTLPFTASDPMELVHCHIARRPTPPCETRKGVPSTISAIIMKLLAKTAEERYQTASGAASDLGRCLAEWETHHRIGDFPLGEQDTPDRLLIPQVIVAGNHLVNTRPKQILRCGYALQCQPLACELTRACCEPLFMGSISIGPTPDASAMPL